MHCDGDTLGCVVSEHDEGDALGDGLDEVDGVALNGSNNLFCEHTVVNCAIEVVTFGCRTKVEKHRHINDEYLPGSALFFEDTVEGRGPKSGESNAVTWVGRG